MDLLRRERRLDTGIDLTPLIDVVFQLLIFLLVSTQFVRPEAAVELPEGPGKGAALDPEQAKVEIVILADNEVLVNEAPVAVPELAGVFRALVEGGTVRAEIRGDRDAHFGTFVEVMETARASGITSLAVIKKTDREDPQTSP